MRLCMGASVKPCAGWKYEPAARHARYNSALSPPRILYHLLARSPPRICGHILARSPPRTAGLLYARVCTCVRLCVCARIENLNHRRDPNILLHMHVRRKFQ